MRAEYQGWVRQRPRLGGLWCVTALQSRGPYAGRVGVMLAAFDTYLTDKQT
jgi:hypothetical protein